MTALAPTPTRALSTLLRDGSRGVHTETENMVFITALMDGRISREGYGAYLSALARVYAALEEVAAAMADDPLAAPVLDDALLRGAALEQDLAFWLGEGWRDRVEPSAAADTYAERIRTVGASWGGYLVAHHYTRYLGDLSGGQVIGRLLARTYDLQPGEGVAFYEFARIPKPKPYKDAYRTTLDALPIDEVDKDRVLGEVQVAFELNGAVFAELGEQMPRWAR
jgi:heme oxygenase